MDRFLNMDKPAPKSKTNVFIEPELLKTHFIGNSEIESAYFAQALPHDSLKNRKVMINRISELSPEQLRLTYSKLTYEDFVATYDVTLFNQMFLGEVMHTESIPVRLKNNVLTILTALPNDKSVLAFFRNKFHVAEIEQLLVNFTDIFDLATEHFKKSSLHQAVYGLYETHRDRSAYYVFSNSQWKLLTTLLLASVAWLYYAPYSLILTFFFIVQTLYFILIMFRFGLTLGGVFMEKHKGITHKDVEKISDNELPIYSILVPIYKEPEAIPMLIKSLKKLDYPSHKLDVLLLFEENDPETFQAALKANPPADWHFVKVPSHHPQTKPKACNYGLEFARGTYLTIFDAEDLPEPDQLKKAYLAHKKIGSRCLCVQASLNYFNSYENFITALFTLEYSYWFDYILPGLDYFRMPIPLGGTSNHFNTENLRKIGGWDAFNTTEDADLGMRAVANDMNVGVINSTTFEEANSQYWNWIRQRSRWIKGYMQTALVYNRHPWKLLKTLGLKNWLSFQLIITGTPLIFLFNPIVWVGFILGLFATSIPYLPDFPFMLTYISVFNLIVGNFIAIYFNMLGVFKRKLFLYLPLALLNPFYWLIFHSVAAYKALFQLFHKPFYWEKTQHGLTQFKTPEL